MTETTVDLERRATHASIYPKIRRRGRETRDGLLDALERELAHTAWARIRISDLTREVDRAPAVFWQYFPDLEAAFDALLERLAEKGREPTEHMRLIAALLEYERKAVRATPETTNHPKAGD